MKSKIDKDRRLAEAVAAYKATGEITAAAKKLGLPRSTMHCRLVRAGIVPSGGGRSVSVRAQRSVGLSRKEFVGQYDVATRTREAIRRALKEQGPDRIVKDVDFRQACGEGSAARSGVWSQVADEDEFAGNRFVCEGKKWWAGKAAVSWVLENVSGAKVL